MNSSISEITVKGQYLISKDEVENLPKSMIKFHHNGFWYYYHQLLNCYHSQGNSDITIIGMIILIYNGEAYYGEKAAQKLSQANNIKEFINLISSSFGRYVVSFNNEIIMGDSIGARRSIFNRNKSRISSSHILAYGGDFPLNSRFKEVINNKRYKNNESFYPSMETFNDEMSFILPNHYLNLNSGNVEHINIRHVDIVQRSASESFDYYLKPLFKCLVDNEYNIKMPITAGYDSRLLLAASRDVHDHINFYIRDHDVTDTSYAKIICDRLGLELNIIPVNNGSEPNERVKKALRKQSTYPRNLKKHSFLNDVNLEIINTTDNSIGVNGTAGEVIRGFYGKAPLFFPSTVIPASVGYVCDKDLKHEIDQWLRTISLKGVKKKHVMDFFYWEYKVGIWGALNSFENELIHTKGISPFGCRSLILEILNNTEIKERKYSKHQIVRDYISENLDLDDIPYNGGISIKKHIKESLRQNNYIKSAYFITDKVKDFFTE